ncbi:MAG: Ig-like domain-containing protein [Thermoleophilaceae bacterium]
MCACACALVAVAATVALAAAPGNDNLAAAEALSGSSVSLTGTTTEATKEAGEPNHAGNAGGHSVWYRWTAPSDGNVAVDTCGSAFDTLLAVYTGDVYPLGSVASDDDAPAGPCAGAQQSRVKFAVTAGTTYDIAVDGWNGAAGSFSLHVGYLVPPTNDDLADAQTVAGATADATGTTVNATKESGEPNHAGTVGGSSIWYSWTAPTDGIVAVDTCSSAVDTVLAVYTGGAFPLAPVASNNNAPTGWCAAGSATGRSAVSFAAAAGTTYKIAVDVTLASGAIGLHLEYVTRPANDDLANAEVLSGSTVDVAGSNKYATSEANEPQHAGYAGGDSLWYAWTAPSAGTVTVDTCGSDFDTLLAVYKGDGYPLAAVVSNANALAGQCGLATSLRSKVAFKVTAGTTYKIAVDGYAAAIGDVSLHLQYVTPPANDDLADATVLTGNDATNTVSSLVATKESGEPNHAGNVGGHSVWYRWTAPASGNVVVDTCSSSFDTTLAIYTGSAYPLTEVARNDDSTVCAALHRSRIVLSVNRGTSYRIAVDGWNGDAGSVTLTLHLTPVLGPANDDLAQATVLSGAPVTATGTSSTASKEAGEPDHGGAPGGRSVWYSWTAPTSGSVWLDTCGSSFNTLLGVYTGSGYPLTPRGGNDDTTAGDCPALTQSTVIVNVTAGTTYKIAVDGRFGVGGSVLLHITYRPANDNLATAQALSGGATSVIANNTGATLQSGELLPGGDAATGSLWYSWTAPANGDLQVQTCGSSFQTGIRLYTGTAFPLTNVAYAGSNAFGCNSSADSILFTTVTAGTTYRIQLFGWSGQAGTAPLYLDYWPANDRFDRAQAVTASPATVTGSNIGATPETGEPRHAGSAAQKSIWYAWTAPSTGPVTVDTCGSSFDTRLGVYTGARVDLLTQVASGDDVSALVCGTSGISTQSQAQFTATAGQTYSIAVDGQIGATGAVSLHLDYVPPPANDNFADAQALTGSSIFVNGQTGAASKETAEPDHAGDGGGHSIWYSWTAPADGAVAIDTCTSAFNTLVGVYTGSALDSLTPVASNNDAAIGRCDNAGSSGVSYVKFTAVAGTTYKFAVDGAGGASGIVGLRLVYPPANDDLADATQLVGKELTASGSTVGATREPTEGTHAQVFGGHSIWYSWTAPSDGLVRLETCGSTFNTALAVYRGSGTPGSLTAVAGNNDTGSGDCWFQSALVFNASAGQTYRFAVDGQSGQTGAVSLYLKLDGAPDNDNLADAQAISGNEQIIGSDTHFATKEPGEPNHAGNGGGRSAWFNWTASETGPVSISTCTNFNSLLAVYPGTGDGYAGLGDALASNDDAPADPCGAGASFLTLTATAGTTYKIAVDGAGGQSGDFSLHIHRFGPRVSTSADSLTYTEQAYNTTSASKTVTVRNTGYAPLHVSGASITGLHGGDFSVSSDGCAASTLQVGTSCNVEVTFTPHLSGTRTASLSIASDAYDSPASVDLTGSGGNVPPHAVDDAATADFRTATPIDVLANDTDDDGGPTAQIQSVTQPAHGAVTFTATHVTYEPNTDYCNDGTTLDEFTYTLEGGSQATVSVTVPCPMPVAVDDYVTIPQQNFGSSFSLIANDIDPLGRPIHVASVGPSSRAFIPPPSADGRILYQPYDFTACTHPSDEPDTFTYTLVGGSTATVHVTVTCHTEPVYALDDSAALSKDDGPTSIDIRSNDAQGDGFDPWVIQSVTQPEHGVVTWSTLGLEFAPDPSACDSLPADPWSADFESFTYTLVGGSTARVYVAVRCSPPLAVDDSFTVVEGSSTLFYLIGNDVDPVAEPAITGLGTTPNAMLELASSRQVGYSPLPGYCNTQPGGVPDTFTYTIAGGSTATVSVTVICFADLLPPVGHDDSPSVYRDSPGTALGVASNDEQGAGYRPWQLESVTDPAHGSVSWSPYSDVSYTPEAGYCNTQDGGEPDTFTYSLVGGSTATVSVTVDCTDPPRAVDDAATTEQDSNGVPIDVLANDQNLRPNSDVVSVGQPAHGAAFYMGRGMIMYGPDRGYCVDAGGEPDTFDYTLENGSTATVSVTVTCPQPADAHDDYLTVPKDSGFTELDIKANDTYGRPYPWIVADMSTPQHGQLLRLGALPAYMPDEGYCNTHRGDVPDSFVYTLDNGRSATVYLTVPCDDAPPEKGDQVIDFSAPQGLTYGDADADLGATVSSGLGVAYTSTTQAVCLIVGGKLRVLGAGDCTVDADQAGDDSYNPAPQVERTFAIAKRDVRVDALPDGATYGQEDPGVSGDYVLRATDFAGQDTKDVATGHAVCSLATHDADAGTYPAAITCAPGDLDAANYSFVPGAAADFVIGKAGQTISFDAPVGLAHGSDDSALGATASSGLGVSYSSKTPAVCTIVAGDLHVAGAGDCTVDADQDGDQNHNAAPQVERTFAVGKREVHVDALPDGKAYGQDDPDVSHDYVLRASDFATGDSADVASGSPECSVGGHAEDAGTYADEISCDVGDLSAANYTFVRGSAADFVIVPAAQEITFAAPTGVTYGGADSDLGATASSGLGVKYASTTAAVCTIVGGQLHVVAAGDCAVDADQPGDANHNAADRVERTFGIAKKQVNVDARAAAKTYGDPDPDVSSAYVLRDSDFVDGDRAAVASGAGTCAIGSHPQDAGTYASAITCDPGSLEAANYTFVAGSAADLTIDKKDVHVDALPDDKAYGAEDPVVSGDYILREADFVPDDTASVADGHASCSLGDHDEDAATYSNAISCEPGDLGAANYSFIDGSPADFAIGKAAQTITFGAPTGVTFGDADSDLGATASSGLEVAYSSTTPDVCTIVGGKLHVVAAGDCTIDADQPGDANHKPALQVEQTFAVSPAAQSITFAAPAGVTYGDPDSSLGGNASSGLDVTYGSQTPSVCTIVEDKLHVLGAGACTIDADQGGNGKYNAAPQVERTFTIAKAPLTVTAADKAVQYSDELPTLTVGYDGFVKGDGAGSLGGTLACTTTAITTSGRVVSPAGTYTIACSGLNSANYRIAYGAATLTVSREDGVVRLTKPNVHIVATDASGANKGKAPALTLTARIQEVADGSYGEIVSAVPVTFTLDPVGSGASVTCAAPVVEVLATTPPASMVRCQLPKGLAANVYRVSATIGGGYYRGSDQSALVVYDSAVPGANAAGGTLKNPVSGADGDLAYSATKKTGLGSFLYLQRDAGEVTHVLEGTGAVSSAVSGKSASVSGQASLDGAGNVAYALSTTAGGGSNADVYGQRITGEPGLSFNPVAVVNGAVYIAK